MDLAAGLELLRRVCSTGSPPVPSDTLQICLELSCIPEADEAYLVESIESDRRLTTQLLILANAVPNSHGCMISTPLGVVSTLGRERIAELLWVIAICNALQPGEEHRSGMRHRLLHHSLLTGVLTENLMAALDIELRRFAMPAGAAHDLGHLLLGDPTPGLRFDWHREHDGLNRGQPGPLPEKDHCRLGASLLKLWDAPIELVEAALYHHAPAEASACCAPLVLCVRLADLIADYVDAGHSLPQLLVPSELPEWEALAATLDWNDVPNIDAMAAQLLADSATTADRLANLLA